MRGGGGKRERERGREREREVERGRERERDTLSHTHTHSHTLSLTHTHSLSLPPPPSAQGYRSHFLHPVVRYYSGLRYDGSEHVHFNHVNPGSRKSAEDVTSWQSHRMPSQAVATHHMLESVFIDFAHIEGHVEPLVRFLSGLLTTRPELLPDPLMSPIFDVKVRGASRRYRRSLHPQHWLRRNFHMQPEELIDVIENIQDLMHARGKEKDVYKDRSAWNGIAMLRGKKGLHFEGEDEEEHHHAANGDGERPREGVRGETGSGVPNMVTQEQLQAFMDALGGVLEQPPAEMPELADVEESVSEARVASERLAERLDKQKRAHQEHMQQQQKNKKKHQHQHQQGSRDGGDGGASYEGDGQEEHNRYAEQEQAEFESNADRVNALENSENMSDEEKQELLELLNDADGMLASLDRVTDLFNNLGKMAAEDEDDDDDDDDVDDDEDWIRNEKIAVRPKQKKAKAKAKAKKTAT